MATFRYSKFKEFQGRGGPVIENPAEKMTKTRAGRYVVGAIQKHRSSSRWPLSTIVWGTPLRIEKGVVQVQQNGRWLNLSSFKAFEAGKKDEAGLLKELANIYQEYKTAIGTLLTPAEKSQTLPDSWIFNDFGHLSIKYFRDKNGNYKRDKGEDFITDFIHTVPREEFFFTHGKKIPLGDSHGCIHVHPEDIDTIVQYLKIGSVIEVHAYSDTTVPAGFDRKFGRPPYELHFYPYISTKDRWAAGNLILYSVTQLKKP